MPPRYILSDYVQEGLGEASYDKLEDSSLLGPNLRGREFVSKEEEAGDGQRNR